MTIPGIQSVIRDHTAFTQISTAPYEITFPLNYWFRFDEPGDYPVNVTTHRVITNRDRNGVRVAIPTNSVTFRIAPMSEADEAAEARRLGQLIDGPGAKDQRHEIEWCDALAFSRATPVRENRCAIFSIRPSTRRASVRSVSRWASTSRAAPDLVLSLLEEALANISVPAADNVAQAAIGMGIWLRASRILDEAAGDATKLKRVLTSNERDKLRREYVARIVASLAEANGQITGSAPAYYALSLSVLQYYGPAPPDPVAASSTRSARDPGWRHQSTGPRCPAGSRSLQLAGHSGHRRSCRG